MTDVTINLPSFGKDVLVSVPDTTDPDELRELFNDTANFVHTLEANHKIRDAEAGINPRGATHEIVREADGYHLNRFRFA